MSPDFRRGAAEIAKAREKAKEGGEFRPFTPKIFWQDDEDSRYVLFLNDLASIPQVEMISFIPVKAKGREKPFYEEVIARTETAIGEDVDPLVRDWDAKPRETNIAVAVELEPILEIVNGRKRPRGFEVKTVDFDRRIRDDKGKLTDESEEVSAPVVGFVQQSPHNFFNVVSSYDANDYPIEDTPLKITRVGKDNSTVYRVDGHPDLEVDLSNLLELVENVSYVGDDVDELLNLIEGLDDKEAAAAIGAFMLDKRLEELSDPERYEELYEGVNESLDRFGSKKSKKRTTTKTRASRTSQRRSRRSEPEEEAPEETPEVEPEAEEPVEEKPKRTRRKKAEPVEEETPAEEPKPKTTRKRKQDDPAQVSKLDELRERAAKRKAAQAA